MRPLPDNLSALLQNELQPGELLLWSGQPRVRWFAGCSTVVDATIGLLMTIGLSAVWLIYLMPDCHELATQKASFILPVFVLLGLFFVSSPLRVHRRARRTVYAITSRRAIIFKPKFFGRHTPLSFSSDVLDEIYCDEKSNSNGHGNLILAHVAMRNKYAPLRPLGFFDIPDVRNVERILLQMRDENLRASNTKS